MKAIDRVGNAERGLEKCVDLGVICQVCLDCDRVHTLRSFGLHNVSEDKLDIGRPRIISQGM